MKALILGAGYATRLYPLTKDRPKTLLPLAGRPLIEYTLSSLHGIVEVDRVYIASNHRFVQRYRDWLETYRGPRKIEIFDDGTTSAEDRLGAIGDVQFVIDRARLQDDLLVLAGDILVQTDFREFVAFARERGTAIAVKDLGSAELARRFGAVRLDDQSRVVDFEEKPATPSGSLVSIGVYLLPRAVLPEVKEYLAAGHTADAPGYFIEWLLRRQKIFGFPVQGPWFDIGDIDSYNQANELLEQGAHG